ncbi:MAG: GWxTD domain-containing protein [Bacteroidales bacterium]|nr:GWxTD domain-containing protein [Bacteroidales bacterium]
MKKHCLFFLVLLFSVVDAGADNLKAHLNYSTFYAPVTGPYIETYMLVEGSGVTFVKNDKEKFQASLHVLVLFKQDEKIIEYNKYDFLSPELTDTLSNVHNLINFMDQQRYTLPNGTYTMEFEISDKHSSLPPLKTTQQIHINYPEDQPAISDILLIDSYSEASEPSMLTRGGYNLIPSVFNFLPENQNELTFYTELYNIPASLGDEEPYLITAWLESQENFQKIENIGRNKREKAKPVTVFLAAFDISALPSGNYNLVVEARDRENNLITSKRKFLQRSNPRFNIATDGLTDLSIAGTFVEKITSVDSLREAIRSLTPLMDNANLIFTRYQLDKADKKSLQRFLFSFWVERSGTEAEYAWNSYAKLVRLAQEKYSNGVSKGYESDRGHTLCKYGKPDHITGNALNNWSYPYEIWQYYSAGNQRDAKFVFYSHDIATQTYYLLHSNMVGEINNPHWLKMLNRNGASSDVEYQSFLEFYGYKILEEYENPD